MSHRDGRVTLSAWVDPVLRDYARVAARSAGLEFSRWVERAIQRAVADESTKRAMRLATADFDPPGREQTVGDAAGLRRVEVTEPPPSRSDDVNDDIVDGMRRAERGEP